MKITIRNHTVIAAAPKTFLSDIRKRLTFTNPKWLENDRMGRWQGDTQRELRFYETDAAGSLIVPRGFSGQLIRLCRAAGLEYQIVDETREMPPVEINFQGHLRPFQKKAVADILPKRFATLDAPTGSGKTVMGLYLIARRRQPACVVVHTKELLNQWVARAEAFLGISASEIGVIGGGKHSIGDKLTVAMVQTLVKCAAEVAPHVGHLVVDECHRTPSRTFTGAVSAFDCRYMLGLSATPWRRDKLSKLIFWHLGDVHHQVDRAELQAGGHIMRAQIVTRETDFYPSCDPSSEYTTMLQELTADQSRNRLITADVAGQVGRGTALVLTDRKQHCRALRSILSQVHGIDAAILTGDVPANERQNIVADINNGSVQVLVATGQLIGEGFDCPGLSSLFLATPIKFNGRLIQYIGRVLRPAPGKAAPVVFDYIDPKVGPLMAAAKARKKVYDAAA